MENQLISKLKSVHFGAKKSAKKAVIFVCEFLHLLNNQRFHGR